MTLGTNERCGTSFGAGGLIFADLGPDDCPRMRELMWKYRDLPMDLADAALVRIAERDGLSRFHYQPPRLRNLSTRAPRTVRHNSLVSVRDFVDSSLGSHLLNPPFTAF